MTGLDAALAAHGLAVLGGFHPQPADRLAGQTLLLIGPDGARFWPIVTTSAEWHDGAPNPIDRFSTRVLTEIAATQDATALFPFGGPPYHPFIDWALRSGQAWASPVQLLVHAHQGLFVSYRGALLLAATLPLLAPAHRPCDACAQPCLDACPVAALTATGYDVPLCHSYLDTDAGADCLTMGCAVRRACPVGQDLRDPAQSAYHMQRFHK